MLLRDQRPGKLILGKLPTAPPHVISYGAVVEIPDHRFHHCVVVVIGENRNHAPTTVLADAADIGGHHWEAARPRLNDSRVGPAFIHWKKQKIRLPIKIAQRFVIELSMPGYRWMTNKRSKSRVAPRVFGDQKIKH